MLREETQEEAAISRAVLTVFRLTKDEFGVRPIALVGSLGGATQAEVEAAPVTSTSGAFNAFSADCTRETRWVVCTHPSHHGMEHVLGLPCTLSLNYPCKTVQESCR